MKYNKGNQISKADHKQNKFDRSYCSISYMCKKFRFKFTTTSVDEETVKKKYNTTLGFILIKR